MTEYWRVTVKGLRYSREIVVDEEFNIDVGDAISAGGVPIGVVLNMREHEQRPGWTVFYIDRPVRGVYRGDELKRLDVPRAPFPVDKARARQHAP